MKIAREFHTSTDYLPGIEKSETVDVSGLDNDDIIMVKRLISSLRNKNSKA